MTNYFYLKDAISTNIKPIQICYDILLLQLIIYKFKKYKL